MTTLDTIHLKDLRYFSHVGVFPEEKADGQYFVLDIDLFFSAPLKAVDSDLLEDSVSYADVYDLVEKLVTGARYDLIERLAGAVADLVLDRFSCSAVRVTVKKPEAPIDGEFAYMGITITRHKKQEVEGKTVYIGLGGNLGEREATLRQALIDLERHAHVEVTAVSSLYETKAWGVTDQPDFLNAVAKLSTSLDPFALLHVLQTIETRHGRVRDLRWGARTLDLDILEIEETTIESPTLDVPHPRITERAFVMIPLAEVKGETVGSDPEVRLYKKDWYCPSHKLKVE